MVRSRMWMTCARVGTGLFALGMIFSAVAKSLGPQAAAAGLLWTHLGQTERVVLVVAGSFLECFVGGLILVGRGCRTVLWMGASLAAALLVLHLMGMASSLSGCGCFGDLAVPDGVVLALLGLGLLACTAALRVAHAGLDWRRLGWVILVSVAVPASAVPGLLQKPTSPIDELRQTLDIEPNERAVALVGTWSCDECKRALDDILDAPPPSDKQVFFVTRASEHLPQRIRSGTFVQASIPDALWWRLVTSAPPVVVRFEPQTEPLSAGFR